MKTNITEDEFRHALEIHDRFEWPDGDYEFWVVWDTLRDLACDSFGEDRVAACELFGRIGNEATDKAWRRGLAIARERTYQRVDPVIAHRSRLAHRVRHIR